MINLFGAKTLKQTKKVGRLTWYKNYFGEAMVKKYSNGWAANYRKGDMMIFIDYTKTKREAVALAQYHVIKNS